MAGRLTALVMLALFIALGQGSRHAFGEAIKTNTTRSPILAGTWYPADPKELKGVVKGYLSKARASAIGAKLLAIIVPHAGYRYSGQVAAHAYSLLLSRQYERIILLGPSHRLAFKGISVNLQAGYETPLGVVPVDRRMAEELIKKTPQAGWNPRAHAREHSLEIQLPFLQMVASGFRIVPILMGDRDYDTCQDLARAIAGLLGKTTKTLLVASSDLSHFHSYDTAVELDREFMAYVSRLDAPGLYRALSRGECEACGSSPVLTALLVAKHLGADHARILRYANSGDVTGQRSRVVGYVSAAIFGPRTR
ncbi:MAG: AmmeMemoRadiSam system protein B [Deltaproteobacteria bacterium]|nr:AmmeMemoRadiSam system protein B [Deltaproteobacteria bacterium]MBW2137038.1 AmmeMemoRadiSam system protein B [Deltaproteobacteria bacterium]